ncbi:pitrilysin family protein [Massilia sp. CF038]|uniref:M16 family metallopeptidase n=1 Tax=Massilia sp. CF038 TaxID=1881045 RepID=UPI0009162EF3|nr:pitrilysin family protein [Massilia sp. CF038]SHH07782.1 zinc protease [Massilia sp. CF038]
MKLLSALMLSAGILSPTLLHAAAVPGAPAAQAGRHGAPVKVTSVEGITEYRLANGMRVLLFPDASKPTLTTNIVYMVGSRHENYGETGMAHLLEHLLFKPTKNFGLKKGTPSVVQVLNASGAEFNGTTWYDRTNYHSTFPANDANLRQMLALEADRMVNSPIDQNDLWNAKTGKGEMTVVRNEFEMGENDPVNVTTERLQAVAFDWHNYGKSTIGARSDIEQVDVARLRAFYQRYYQPDNALLMVAGRFDEAKVLAQINDLFGRIPKPSRKLTPTYTREPVQDGERAVTVRRVGGTQYVGAGYHTAPSGHPDAVALEVLGHILTEAPAGRLHKALVESKLATSVSSDSVSNLEPGYRIFGAVVPKELALGDTEAAMLKVLENLKAQPVTDAEVARARLNMMKQIELAANDTASLTVALTEAMAAGDWRLFFVQRDQLEKMDAATVQAAAEKYLKPSNRTLGRFIPTDAAERTEVPAAADVSGQVDGYRGRALAAQGESFDPSPANIEARLERFTLPNGLRGALLSKTTKGGVVNLTLQMRTGSADALKGRGDAAALTAALLARGTERLTRQDIRDAFDKLGTVVNMGGGATGVSVSLMTKRANLAASLALVAEILKTPTFPETEFAEILRQQINAIEQQLPEPQALADNARSRLVDATPEGHVNHVRTLPQQLADLKAVSLADVRAFHRDFYGANNITLAVVGDFDAAALKAQVTDLFGAWQATLPYVRIAATVKEVAGQKVVIDTPEKANSTLFAVLPLALKDDHPDYPALMLANHMLGGGALHSRLANRIRQNEGLSYGVGSFLNVSARDPVGLWAAYAISAPQNTARVEAALREEVALALKDGFTEAELAEAKKGWRQAEEVARTDDGSLAGYLANYLSYGRTLDYDKAFEAQVAALKVGQVNAALRKYLDPAKVSVVSAGDLSKAGAAAKPK